MPKFSLSFTEKLMSDYPWYSLGYLDIYENICKVDRESSGVYLEKAASRVYSRDLLYKIYNGYSREQQEETSVDDLFELDYPEEAVSRATPAELTLNPGQPAVLAQDGSEEEILSPGTNNEPDTREIADFVPDNTPRFILAGGDYFTIKDFEDVKLDKTKPLDNFIAEKPSLLRSALSGKGPVTAVPACEIDSTELFDDASFYTETLANIYLEQGFHKQAVDVYAKLILLFPEKSSYFATLVKGIKEKYNQ
jgi:hypothetical protein